MTGTPGRGAPDVAELRAATDRLLQEADPADEQLLEASSQLVGVELLDEAERVLRCLVRRRPGRLGAVVRLANLQIERGHPEEALELYDRARGLGGGEQLDTVREELARMLATGESTAGADYYDAVYDRSAKYAGPAGTSPYLPVWERAIDALRRAGARSVLDVGCGPGQFAELLLARADVAYRGFDFSPTAIAMARARSPEAAFEVRCIDDHALEQDPADVVVCTEVLEHLDDDLALVRRLRPGARLIASVPSYWSFGHVRRFFDEDAVRARYDAWLDDLAVDAMQMGPGRTVFVFDGLRKGLDR